MQVSCERVGQYRTPANEHMRKATQNVSFVGIFVVDISRKQYKAERAFVY